MTPVITDAPRRVIAVLVAEAINASGTSAYRYCGSDDIPWRCAERILLSLPAPAPTPSDETDKCEFCLGAKGGVRGNENIIGGHIVCDYCHVICMDVERAAPSSPSPSERREEIARALWESDETLYLESGRLPWEKATPGDRAAAYRRADAILSLPAPAPAPVSLGWRPISEAPHDGTPILTWNGHVQSVLLRWPDRLWEPTVGGIDLDYGEPEPPTYWQPLPDPPSLIASAPSPDQPSEEIEN